MSAWIVSNKHINSMVQFGNAQGQQNLVYIYHQGESHYLPAYEQGRILMAQNVRSVDARYNESNSDTFTYTPLHDLPSAVQIIKACDCYDYQACETGDYHETLAYTICNAIRKCAINALPGYGEAAWGIE